MSRVIISCVSICWIALLLPCCNAIEEALNLSQPVVESVYPAHCSSGISGDVVITVTFSKKMDKVRTASAFTLSSETGIVHGEFRWDDSGRKMSFYPSKALSGSAPYTISITEGAEDSEGNDLKEAYQSIFALYGDTTPPRVISFSPQNAVNLSPPIPRDTNIVITFSESIDVATLSKGFSITPAVEGIFTWDAARKQISFDPVYNLQEGAGYTVTVGREISDISGNNPVGDTTWSFRVGNDFRGPAITSVSQDPGPVLTENTLTGGAEKNSSIVIRFSEPVTRESSNDAISISPYCRYHVEGPLMTEELTLVFDDPLESESTYSLQITPRICDASGNQLDREYRYDFHTDGMLSKRPAVLAITDANHGFPDNDFLTAGNHWSTGEIEYLPLSEAYGPVYIIFSAAIDPVSIGIDIEKIAGGSAGLMRIQNPDWPVIGPFERFRVYRFDISGFSAGNIYRLTIKGGPEGLRDTRGNTLKEDYIQYIRI